MNDLNQKLIKRLKPHDGLVIDADVWTEAHNEHRWHQQAHLRLGHGPGIITGLDIEVDKPPGNRVWVQPGIAVDALGRLIVLTEKDDNLISTAKAGLQYLYLKRLEPKLELEGRSKQYEVDLHLFSDGSSLPTEAVELARVRVVTPNRPVEMAKNPDQPQPHELDLRFRRYCGAQPQPVAGVAIHYLGKQGLPEFGAKAVDLARTLSNLTRSQVVIDDKIALTHPLEPYNLLYLVENETGTLPQTELKILKIFLEAGGTVFVENYSQQPSPLPTALGVNVHPGPPPTLLTDPFLFSMPPPGFSSQVGSLQYDGDGLIISHCEYGRLWQCEPLADPARSREAIRAATEWAANLVTYAAKRRLSLNQSKNGSAYGSQ